jgi:hypothetical protein
MRLGRRSGFTGAQLEEIWQRYKAGETVSSIALGLGRLLTTVDKVLRVTGGFTPARRTRSARVLSLREREEISRGLAAGCSFRALARGLKRAVSTISQEVARHGGRERYRAEYADRRAWHWARRPKRCLLARNRLLLPNLNRQTSVDGGSDRCEARKVTAGSSPVPCPSL